MLPPIKIPVPSKTNTISLTALSLFENTSTVSVSWTYGGAIIGADFAGPSDSYVLGDSVFGSPIVTFTTIPSEVSVSFDFEDTVGKQHSVSKPITKKVGAEGSATSVQISGYDASDKQKRRPTTITILFQGSLRK